MVTKFDSFSRFETPKIFICSPGCRYNNGVLSNVSGVLFGESDTELVANWNAISEINFRVHKLRLEDATANAEAQRLYQSLKNRRMLYVDDIGFFVIRRVEEGYESGLCYKDIMAESCETEIADKNVPFINDGTYQLYTGHVEYNDDGTVKMNSESGQALTGLLDYLMLSLPLWNIGDVSELAAIRYRTFEDVSTDQNIYSFMMENMQDAYEIIFDFDITNRVINVYDQSEYLDGNHDTDIHIAKDDFINTLEVTESSDDLYTALSVFGADELTVNAVNPLGTNVIYDFGYYAEWMSGDLGEKVLQWQEDVKGVSDEYYEMNVDYYADKTTASNIQMEIDRLNTAITMYERCKANVVAEADEIDVEKYNEVLVQAGIDPTGLIPENSGYTWVKFASSSIGTGITSDPYGMPYVGFAYGKAGRAESIDPDDYTWHLYRDGEAIPDGNGTYTWIKFGDTSRDDEMSDDPDVQDEEGNGRAKNCIGISLGNATPERSTDYEDYTWVYTNRGNIGVPQVLARIVTLYQSANDELEVQQEALEDINDELAEKYQQIKEVHDTYGIGGYFTAEEQAELNNYVYEGTYTDEYISVTESMTQSERLGQMKTLYDRAVQQLKRISTPSQEFNIDSRNFIFIKEFKRWSDQLEAGCAINVEIAENDVAPLFMTSMTVNFEDRNLQMTFGNRLDRKDTKSVFEDVLGDVKKSANTLAFVKDTISVIKGGTINKMQEALNRSRTLTKGQALAATNETVVIDDTGYTGARIDEYGRMDPHQIKINGRNIVFSDDAWETCKTAIGEILMVGSDGTVTGKYGINAEVILGDLIMGNQLKIVNTNGDDMFVVTEEKITAEFDNKLKDYALDVTLMFCQSTSDEPPLDPTTITIPWSTTAPHWEEGKYIWQKTVTTYGDGTETESVPTCLSGAQGRDGVGVDTIFDEYYLSTSDVVPQGGTWSTLMYEWRPGYYIWTRNRIKLTDGSETTTDPVLSSSMNRMSETLSECVSKIEINNKGIRQNTEYYQQLYDQVAKINAYIQTGVLSVSEDGKTSYGVKIGETLATTDAYIITGSDAFTAGWLSKTQGGSALTPEESVIYAIKTPGIYFGKAYRWNSMGGSAGTGKYEETSSEGTLSSVFTSSELGFYDTGEKTAYFSNKNLNVRTVRTNKVLLSPDVIADTETNNWQIGIDDGFYLKWIGG